MKKVSMKKETVGSLQVVSASICLGTLPLLTSLCYKVGLNAITILAFRFLIATSVIWSYFWFTKTKLNITLKQITIVGGAGILGYGLMSLTYLNSFHYIPSSMSAMILLTYPVIVTYLSSLLLKSPITKDKIVAVILITLGGILMGWGKIAFNPFGIFLAVLSTILYALYILFLGSPLTFDLDSKSLAAIMFPACALFNFIVGTLQGDLILDLTPTSWLLIVIMALLGTGFSIMFFSSGVQKVGSTTASILGNVEPFTAFILGIFILGENATITQWMGALLIFLGVLYIQFPKQKIKGVGRRLRYRKSYS